MDTNNVERNLRALRRLYGLLHSNANNEPFLLDADSQFLLKNLLDSATKQILATQSKIIAEAQIGLQETLTLLNLPDSSSVKTPISVSPSLERIRSKNASQIKRNVQSEQVTSLERIDSALSAFSFRSSRAEFDDNTRSYESPSVTPIEDYSSGLPYETRRLTEKALMEHRQRMSQTASSSKITPSLRSVKEATEAIVPTLPPDDQFVRVKSRAPLPSTPVKSVGFKKPSQSKRMTQKMRSIKPTLLDQETESWDESESEKTRSRTSSDDEQLVSTEQESDENSEGSESRSSGSSWETQEESVSGEENSNSSYTSESKDDESELSASPPRDKSSSKQRKKAVMGRLTRFKNKFGQVFHLHQHHHHHHHPHNKEQAPKPSAWNHLQRALHYKRKEKTVEKRMKSEFKGLATNKQKGGHFHGLVEGLMRHRKRASTKQKHKFPSHGKKKHWWQTNKRQGRVKFPKKLGKKHYLL